MIQNIAIIGLNRDVSYEVAKQLATELDMFFFDALELFEFDNMPKTFSSLLSDFGEKYYRRKEKREPIRALLILFYNSAY